MGKNILVTGASGWLGLAVVKALLERGDHVIAMDLVCSSGLNSLLSKYKENLSIVECNLAEWSQVLNAFREHNPDAVIHAAAIVGVVAAADIPLQTMRVNVEGTINLLEAMRCFEVKRMVHISTEETYGDFELNIIDEEYRQRPTSVYGLTKLAAENYGRVYSERYGMEFINIRTCWVYGPYLPRARVPKVFIDAALTGESYHLASGGDLAVDQVYISDTVQGVLLALDKQTHHYDSYHIATGVAPTIEDVAAIVRDLIPGAQVTTSPGPYMHGDKFVTAKKGALDISRARKELGYSPKFDLRAGIAETINASRS